MSELEVNGARLHVEDRGQGRPVIFVHGWGASTRFWDPTIDLLHGRRRCLAFDWKGFGRSDKPRADYRMEEYCEELRQLADRLVGGRFVLVGHSMGGLIAALFALRHPDRLDGLVLCNAPLRGPSSLSWLLRLLLSPIVAFVLFVCARVRWLRRFGSGLFTHRRPLPDVVLEDFARGTYQAQMAAQRSIQSTDLSTRLSEINVPTLVVHTDHDRIIRAEQFALALERIPGARSLAIPETGHCPMLEAPERFVPGLSAFLDEVQPSAPAVPPAIQVADAIGR